MPRNLPTMDQLKILPIVAIIGRPNVGKSTLFNRILGTRHAIVDDMPGVTRDRNYADCTYQNRQFQIVDTGGYDPSETEGLVPLITQQSQQAIQEADVLVLVMDGRAGLTPLDQEVASLLRKSQKPVYYAVNKIDSPKLESLLADFYSLGQDTLFPVSAEQGIGVDELLEAMFPHLPLLAEEEPPPAHPHIAVVGRPNTGKSTIINTLLGQERIVVSDIPGTTRDPVDSLVTYHNRQYIFTDTAGIRRRGKIDRGIEGYSFARTLKALGRSDIAVLMLDAVEGVTEQDTKIAGLILKQGRGCILVVNKWDLRKGEGDAQKTYTQNLKRRFPFLAFVPVMFGSALNPKILDQLFPQLDQVITVFKKRIPTSKLNIFLQKALEQNPIPLRKSKPVKSVYMTQVATSPPTFALFVRQPVAIKSSWVKYLENQLRESFPFEGTPIRILIREK
ncbi:MAG: ribosome biogenesis GTPase Der [Nitrospirae bacterium]|nr:ribosome biogenesis GTPase Der [Nitrospirota bacterium]